MTDAQPRWATAKDLRAFSDETSPRIVELLETLQPVLPAPERRGAKTAARSFSFTREVKLTELTSIVAYLAAYGEFDHLNSIAMTVAPTPFTGNETVYEPVRRIVHAAYYFAARRADSSTTGTLQPYLFVPADFTRSPTYLAGWSLRRLLDMPVEEAATYSKHPVRYHAEMIVLDLLDLASISVCGGSSTWTPERIDAQVDKTIAGLFAVPGYAPPAP
ncbi:hypothetical protein [Microbacterium sp. cx-59]|uniref:hypothetical protein n=1 Tax=Microbacterium sp. cx-59 TaxID=2891207 RepID=UPI001E40B02B|nr:hypothetical protein [Microbacterium sp. cx-59]MCC4908949.1 hypothetical protein [Microbacterium sp. cx-59]